MLYTSVLLLPVPSSADVRMLFSSSYSSARGPAKMPLAPPGWPPVTVPPFRALVSFVPRELPYPYRDAYRPGVLLYRSVEFRLRMRLTRGLREVAQAAMMPTLSCRLAGECQFEESQEAGEGGVLTSPRTGCFGETSCRPVLRMQSDTRT